MSLQYLVGGKPVVLNQTNFKAAGGEGNVYVKSGLAYKVYHDPSKMIAPGKISELSILAPETNILGPQDIIYAGNSPVGFTMRFKPDTEFLCKLFAKGFRDKNGVTPEDINALVKNMQDTLRKIHAKNILVVDYNEFNFLVGQDWRTAFHIDVDSWQTPSYPATAIMESIRDRKVSNKKFTQYSDWFSFACVAFQLYIGAHPYKGRHPDFSPKDWMEMMNQGISIFNRKCKLPPACQSLDVIPKGHLKWFEAVLEKGERTAPPEPDQVQVVAGPVKAKIITGNDKFNISLVQQYDSQIVAARYIDGVRYVVTQTSVFGDTRQFMSYAKPTVTKVQRDVCPVLGDAPVLVEYSRVDGKLRFKTFKDVEVGVVDSKGFFIANRAAYTVIRDSLIEISFRNSGVKVSCAQLPVANIFHNNQVFDGLVAQNILRTCRLAIPYESGRCANIRVPELDKARLIDAKYEAGVAIILTEEGGKNYRHTLVFNKGCTEYTIRTEKDSSVEDINFTVKDNGVCIASNGDNLEIFLDNSKVKLVESPLNNNEQVISFKNDTLVINGDSIQKISSK